jgi:ABC-2 type transport system permease protein
MSAVTAPQAPRGRLVPLGRLAFTELKLYTRERTRMVLGVGLPLVLIVIIGSIPYFKQPRAAYGGHRFIDIYTPIMVAFAIALLSLTALPMVLAGYRERGILRGLRATPIGPARVLLAEMVANLTVIIAATAAILALARIGYSVALPSQFGGFVLAALLLALSLMGIGLFVAAIAPGAKAAQTTGALLFYPLMFFAGLWLPIANMPATLQHISHATPLGAGVQAMTDAAAGRFPTGLELLTMAAWAVGSLLVAARFFRWE